MAKINVRDRNKNIPDRKPNWEYRFEAAKIDGKRKHISKAGFRTKKDALDAGAKAMAEYNNAGVRFEPSEISVSDYLDFWYKEYVKVNLRYNTQLAYINVIENHLKPFFGKYKLKSLTPAIMQTYINEIYTRNKSKSYTFGILSTLQSSLDYAVYPMEYIKDNPMRHIKIKSKTRPSRERCVISQSNFDKILEMFPYRNRYHIMLLIGWYCGLRISECCALTWDDVDLENKTLSVTKQLIKRNLRVSSSFVKKLTDGEDRNSGWFFTSPKYNSVRVIKICDDLCTALKEEKSKQDKDRKKYGEYYTTYIEKIEKDEKGDDIIRLAPVQEMFMKPEFKRINMICVDENGLLSTREGFVCVAKKIRNKIGIDFDYHSLRHTHATMLIENGANVKTVQKRLGHKNVTTTLQKYVHDTEDLQDEAVDIINSLSKNLKNVHPT